MLSKIKKFIPVSVHCFHNIAPDVSVYGKRLHILFVVFLSFLFVTHVYHINDIMSAIKIPIGLLGFHNYPVLLLHHHPSVMRVCHILCLSVLKFFCLWREIEMKVMFVIFSQSPTGSVWPKIDNNFKALTRAI